MSIEADIEEVEPGQWDAMVWLNGAPILGRFPFDSEEAARTWADAITAEIRSEVAA